MSNPSWKQPFKHLRNHQETQLAIGKEELLCLSQYITKEFRHSRGGLYPSFSGEILSLAAKGSILSGKPDLDFDLSILSDDAFHDIGAAVRDRGLAYLETT